MERRDNFPITNKKILGNPEADVNAGNVSTQNARTMNSTKAKPSVLTPEGRDCCADLLKLADAFYDNLERERHCEFGGWGLDDKRPFGNSDVVGDILEIIDYPPVADDCHSREQRDYALELYDELGGFLTQQWMEHRKG